jgi:hypothetical protein
LHQAAERLSYILRALKEKSTAQSNAGSAPGSVDIVAQGKKGFFGVRRQPGLIKHDTL